MADEPTTQEPDEGAPAPEGNEGKAAGELAREAAERHDKAEETMKKLEEDPPEDLQDWPDDQAKYVTFGGPEGDHSYEEGPESKLGPSSLERHSDGSISIGGEEVDDPDEHRGKPIPGGPTDPDAPETPGEQRFRERRESSEGAKKSSGSGGEGGGEAESSSSGGSDDAA